MSQDILTRIASVVGPNGLLTEPTDMAPFLEEERGLYHGKALAVVRPASTKDVSDVVKLCAEAGVAIIPQGGNTGLCGGGCPTQDGPQIIISTGRMNAIRSIDPLNFTMTVEAGVVLQTIQQKADEAGCLFPLSLGAEGSCQIGGNISTNAGGSGVLRYGNTRELVLGRPALLAQGQYRL